MALYQWLYHHPYQVVAAAAALFLLVLFLAIFFGVWWGSKLARRAKPRSVPLPPIPVRVVIVKMYKRRTGERVARKPRLKGSQLGSPISARAEQDMGCVHRLPPAEENLPAIKEKIYRDADTFSLSIYYDAAIRERLLSQRPLRVSVCNYEDVSNRIYPMPRFCENQQGFYCLTRDGELFPHPEAFNGYYTPSLLQGTLLLDVCFAVEGDKILSASVAGLTPARVKHIDGDRFELTDRGIFDLRG